MSSAPAEQAVDVCDALDAEAAPPEEAPEEAPVGLLHLPVDVLLRLATLLDGRDLAALDATATELRKHFRGRLAPLWLSLHCQLSLSDESTEAPRDDSDATRKSAYVRTWAAMQRRCPRCGRQGRRAQPGSDEEGGLDTGRYMHLCEWLTG